MKKEKRQAVEPVSLRQKAEGKLRKQQVSIGAGSRKQNAEPGQSETDSLKLLHELQVHQLELEMQKEELQQALDQANTATKQYADLYEEIYDFSPAGYLTLDEKCRISAINLSGAIMVGIERDPLMNMDFKRFILKDSLPVFNNFIKNIFDTSTKQTCEIELSRIGSVAGYFYLEGIQYTGLQKCLVTLVEITEHRRLEKAMAESDTQWQTTFDAIDDAVIIMDNKQVITRSNKAMLDLFPDTINGRHCWEVVHGTSEPITQCPLPKMKLSLKRESFEMKLADKWFDVTMDPFFDVDNQLAGAVHIMRDITERKQAQENLRESQELLSHFIDGSPIYAFIKESSPTESRVLYASANFKQMIGIDCQAMVGKTNEELFPNDHAARFTDDDWAVVAGGEMITHDEELNGRKYTIIKFPIYQGNKTLLAGYAIDMTDIKLFEAELEAKNALIKSVFSAIQDGILVLDSKGVHIEVNEALCRIIGFTKDELLGVGPPHPYWAEESVTSIEAAFHRTMQGDVGEYELMFKRKNGGRFPVIVAPSPLRDSEGNIVSYTATVKDITERKQAEAKINRLNEILEQRVVERTAKLQSAINELEGFSYSASHEIRTPLRALNGYASLLIEDYSSVLDAEGNRMLNIIVDSANKMGHLIDDLLSFTRFNRQEIVCSDTDMFQMAKWAFGELTTETEREQIDFRIQQLPDAYTDLDMMQQVWLNLIGNAIKFTSRKTERVIEIGAETGTESTVYFVKDNGMGFDNASVDKLFEVFRRLPGAADFEGTGIGLAIVKRVLQNHKGRVWAEGKTGIGATFYFEVPLKGGKVNKA